MLYKTSPQPYQAIIERKIMANDEHVKKLLQLLKAEDVKYVDLRFTDLRGKSQHITQTINTVDEDFFEDGIMFDGSSIAGWRSIEQSDMILKPDPTTAVMDPFAAQPTMIMFCGVNDPASGQPYTRDPRFMVEKAISYTQSLGIADTVYFGPEAEFFVFDEVRYEVSMNQSFYILDSDEGPYVSGEERDGGNYGHRPGVKGGYVPVSPVDSAQDLRSEMVSVLQEMGLDMEKHHHEVAPSQHELGVKFDKMLGAADKIQLYKYAVQMVAHSYGKTATFMPKPISGDNGSGMHVNQSLWKDGKNIFAGSLYADLSETCLYYIGGIIRHARALNAFSNSTTNSYKRLVPGFEAPVLLAYSAQNRSASCRIPYAINPKAKRVEVRFPDPAGNPYLVFTSMLMAGLDGVRNKIHPGEAMDKDLYDLPPEELKNIPTVARSLREALSALDGDRDFLKQGDVMNDDCIDSYIALKEEECDALDLEPHPVEFKMYYSQ